GGGGGGGSTLGVNPPPPSGPIVQPTVRAWAVNKITDTTGNILTVAYDGNSQDATTTGQIYPTEIDYACRGAGNTICNSVKLIYMTRAGSVVMFQAGAFTETTKLLTDIKTYAGTAIVSDYRLAYNFASQGDQHDELTQVKLCAGDQANSPCLEPTGFTWQ